MSEKAVPLTVVSNANTTNNFVQIAIGKNTTSQDKGGYWFMVINRSTLAVVYNQVQKEANKAPDLTQYNNSDHILIVATSGVGLNNQPQGDLFTFLDKNGGGRELRRIDQIGTQFNCGTYGSFGYALVGVLGNANRPGFEASQITPKAGYGPFLTLSLMPSTINGKTVYTPAALSNS